MGKGYYFPPVVLMGPDAIELIPPEINRLGVKKALIVTDKNLVKVGIVKAVTDILDAAKLPYAIFDKVKENPTVDNCNEGYEKLQAEGCDYVLSIGGGSPQDTGSGIAILATNPGDLRDYEGVGKTKNKSIPIVGINTTAGTAAEATINYVITDEKRKVKMVIVDPNALTTVAVNDPKLMLKMPASLTAATGMDALTHAIEGYTTAGATQFTDLFNLEAIKVIAKNLRAAVKNGDDLEARDQMAYGQFVTGMGFSNGGLGIVHSMAHQLGGFYDLPHGVCNAVLLPYVVAYNQDAVGDRLADIAVAMGEDISRKEPREVNKIAIDAIKKLSADVGIPSGLKELGVKEEDFEQLADMAMVDACTPGNPRVPTKEDMIAIYKKAF